MLDLALLRIRSLATANLAAAASAAALFGTLILLPFYLTTVLGYDAVGLGLGITPIALSFVLVAPLAGRALARGAGSVRLAVSGISLAAAGALAMALAAPAQSYLALLPGLVAFGVGLAVSSSPITTTAIHDVPPARLGVASALPNIFRYTGGALGTAVLGALLHAAIPAGAERSAGRVAPAWSDLVSGGFRASLIAATGFLVLAGLIASRMPPLDRRPAAAGAHAAPVARRAAAE
jgi:Na+/melibiose symporter-like transporter